MTDTPEQKYYKTKNVLLIISFVGIVILAFVLLKKCGSEKAASIAYDNIKNRLNAVLDDSAKAKQESEAMKKDIQQLDTALADSKANEDLMHSALVEKSNKADRLERQLQKAKLDKDTVTIMAMADTCCAENSLWKIKVNALVAGQKLTDSLYKLIVKKADSLGRHWERKYDSCLSAVLFSSTELPKLEPKGQWFGTGGGFVSGPVFGATGGITHITKKQLLISAKGVLTNYGPGGMVEVGMPFNIFKRK